MPKEKQNKQAEFEQAVENLNLQSIIDEEVRKIREERDFINRQELTAEDYKNDLGSMPDLNGVLGGDLKEIAGRLGIKYEAETD